MVQPRSPSPSIFPLAWTACLRACTSRNGSIRAEADRRLERETGFDPDLWIVEVEDREGRPRLDLAGPG